MKNVLPIVLLFVFINCAIYPSFGQSKIDTISLKKGEVFDILLLNQNPDTQADLKSYFKSAGAVAKRMTYQPLPVFKITNHTKGNLRPNLLVLAKWDNMEFRENFLTQIVKEVADFHERRRKIWSYFGLRYFEIEEDLSFEIHRDRYHIASAYWSESESQSAKFYKKWNKEVQKSGGEILIELKDGKLPFGYQYNPEYFVITSWQNETDFNAFQEKIKKLELDNIQHVNEFILK